MFKKKKEEPVPENMDDNSELDCAVAPVTSKDVASVIQTYEEDSAEKREE